MAASWEIDEAVKILKAARREAQKKQTPRGKVKQLDLAAFANIVALESMQTDWLHELLKKAENTVEGDIALKKSREFTQHTQALRTILQELVNIAAGGEEGEENGDLSSND